ncbi:SUKH-4 family immunity protein [Saccharopolyspora gregorii]|uniref:SUKH-4 immunity protein of toxin-antitoxin system n=1 Tax=Saccharopolyspora gregorii TaxID=33914 RepID=A0ABP6RTW1_9PSEU
MSEHRRSVARALAAPLDRLVVAEDRVVAPPSEIGAWGLAARERDALAGWGLPVVEECGLIGNFQQGASPELEAGGRRFYALGLFLEDEIGVDAESGEVRGIRVDDGDRVSFINSSAGRFVESAWRWYWVWKEVRELRFSIEQYDLIDDFLEFLVALDPPVGSSGSSFWRGMLMSWQS